ncbi:Uncharacterized protein BM_BM17533 [Brugia malayi]|uniref:Uncharacterized protein n=1 Tax=Brugia malayi TaxID=6279 RepID=A0A4E9FEA4_BRUMA|nr:Uncharacterized protein BM_BM17533 [Brugia malayi]VIO94569.1 Uncharacterized protein BM_BM17533 [Brugia malayi]
MSAIETKQRRKSNIIKGFAKQNKLITMRPSTDDNDNITNNGTTNQQLGCMTISDTIMINVIT